MALKKNWMSGDKAGIMVSAVAFMALWAIVAIAGLNEDLIEAATRGDLPEVKRLVDNGANVNAKDKDGWTALMAASYEGHQEIVQALLDKGADVNAKANNGISALMLASQNSHREMKGLLIKAGAK